MDMGPFEALRPPVMTVPAEPAAGARDPADPQFRGRDRFLAGLSDAVLRAALVRGEGMSWVKK